MDKLNFETLPTEVRQVIYDFALPEVFTVDVPAKDAAVKVRFVCCNGPPGQRQYPALLALCSKVRDEYLEFICQHMVLCLKPGDTFGRSAETSMIDTLLLSALIPQPWLSRIQNIALDDLESPRPVTTSVPLQIGFSGLKKVILPVSNTNQHARELYMIVATASPLSPSRFSPEVVTNGAVPYVPDFESPQIQRGLEDLCCEVFKEEVIRHGCTEDDGLIYSLQVEIGHFYANISGGPAWSGPYMVRVRPLVEVVCD